MLKEGQKVLVKWDRKGWLAGIFEGYCAGEPNEAFQRCFVKMDNGYACHSPGFHPDCVKPATPAP